MFGIGLWIVMKLWRGIGQRIAPVIPAPLESQIVSHSEDPATEIVSRRAGGQMLRLRRTWNIVSAASFSVTNEMSIDGGPFVRLGTGDFKKN